MANVAVVGAQWGDEGKGKIVDWLSRARRRRRALPGRPQCRPHAGHRRHDLQASLLPSGVVRPGKLSIIGNGVVVDPWALLDEIETRARARASTISPDNLRIAENAPLILPLHGELDRLREEAARGDAQDRHHRPRHRPGLRGQGRRAAPSASATSPTRRRSRPRSTSCCCTTTRCGAASARRRSTPPSCSRAARDRAAPAAVRRARLAAARRGAARAAAASCSRARRARCSTSTTAPILTSPRRTPWPGGRRRRRHRARRRSTTCSASPRPTPRASAAGRSRPSSTDDDRRAAGRARPRVRHRHRPAAPLRLVRRRAGPPGGEDRRHPRHRAHQARRARRVRRAQGLHRLQPGRPDATITCPAGTAARPRSSRSTRRCQGWPESTRGARSWADLPANAIKYVRRIEELIERPGGPALDQPRARGHDPGSRSLRRLTPALAVEPEHPVGFQQLLDPGREQY